MTRNFKFVSAILLSMLTSSSLALMPGFNYQQVQNVRKRAITKGEGPYYTTVCLCEVSVVR